MRLDLFQPLTGHLGRFLRGDLQFSSRTFGAEDKLQITASLPDPLKGRAEKDCSHEKGIYKSTQQKPACYASVRTMKVI